MEMLVISAIFIVIGSDIYGVNGLETLSKCALKNKWCNEEKFGANHTMCIYKKGAQPACGRVSLPGLPSQVYSLILS